DVVEAVVGLRQLLLGDALRHRVADLRLDLLQRLVPPVGLRAREREHHLHLGRKRRVEERLVLPRRLPLRIDALDALGTEPVLGSRAIVLPIFCEMFARMQDAVETYPCSMSATGLERFLIASRKSRWWPRLAVAAWASKSSSVLSSGYLSGGSNTALPLMDGL